MLVPWVKTGAANLTLSGANTPIAAAPRFRPER
ncbi:MAG: autotransporter-associated beta strand repeat-containing protein [Sphingomonadales bacterium]|nr:autotransporter-associated beta strand repeat-containing protein [Sphingomonadales bacterium]